ncbi:Immunity protein Imm1 [Actinopolyspora xinjiangensis]|uniref:Immunity protein Imm1 n=1 Tax=Actinopolyspora xinjiangensis TaxID=405564 RepID=A0A1H0QLC0_9ACTN|nr:Imm1 family immunity protein [Actinopolyspora xinjiangensis]SDP17478.1 Immunity protein Imm1 [Actinopolyspora xinjiangensis]
MTTVETGTVVSVLYRRDLRHAHTDDELDALVREITENPPRPVCEVFVWDRPCRFVLDGEPEFPDARLLVSSSPNTGWGALNYVDPHTPHGRVVDSYNPDAEANAPILPLDPDGADFPNSAALPLEQVREAITEYCRTGQRPTRVEWQPGQWY